MKPLHILVALSTVLANASQEPPMGVPPKELKALNFMMGEFEADLQMFEPGQKEGTPFKGVVTTGEALNGMYIETRHDSDMGGMQMKGLQLTSYDPGKKKFMSYWFDSVGPGGLELWGTLKGQTLVLESKPSEIIGMPGKHAFRSTTSMKGAGKLLFRLEMNSGKGWYVMIEGTMTKK